MKLRPVVASLVVAGLISSPVLATAKNVHKHHKSGTTNTRPLARDFGAQAALITQNNAKSPVSSFDWTNRIHLSGYVNVDARYASRGPLGIVPLFTTSDNAHELNVNNANLFVDAIINKCVEAHIGFAYVADSVNLFDLGLHTLAGFTPLTESVRSDKGSVFAGGEVSVDEAYITISDFSCAPVYFRAGKMYVPFGTYHNPYPISYSLPQLLSQTRATAAEFGYVSNCGFYGNVYILDGSQSAQAHADEKYEHVYIDGYGWHSGEYTDFIPYTRVNNYGAKVGYEGTFCCMDIHADVAYIKDIRDVSYLADIQDLLGFSYLAPGVKHSGVSGPRGFGMQSAGGASVHADAAYCAWHFSFDYVTALRNMIRHEDSTYGPNQHHSDTRAWAADVTSTYNTCVCGYNTAFALSYQFSRQTGGIMPKWRYQGDISVELMHNTSLTFEYRHDRDYDKHADDNFCNYINNSAAPGYDADNVVCGGTGRTSNQATLRLGVVF